MVARGADSGSLSGVSDTHPLMDLLRAGTLDAELAALVWLLLDARTPVVVVGTEPALCERVIGGLRGVLPEAARLVEVAPDDDFAWLPEAVELGWRRDRPDAVPWQVGESRQATACCWCAGWVHRMESADPGHGSSCGRWPWATGCSRRWPATGWRMCSTRCTLPKSAPSADERSRLGVVLVVADDAGTGRVAAAHYVRPVALDTHGHVQRPAPAILATWNPGAGRWDHFAWGVLPDIAGRLGIATVELEREQARRAAALSDATRGG